MARRNSILNPLAITFVPSSFAGIASTQANWNDNIMTRNLASKLVRDLYEIKRANGEKLLMLQELETLIEKLIWQRYKRNNLPDGQIIRNYLAGKLPPVVNLNGMGCSDSLGMKEYSETESRPIDMPWNRLPKATDLLTAFWGLYRHEQALRPLLSLTYRPFDLVDKVWSVTRKDLPLWNSCITKRPCSCPPMFGYIIPPDFFGNPFKLNYCCTETCIHLNRYGISKEGNEFILQDTTGSCCVNDQNQVPFDEGYEKPEKNLKLDFYSKNFKTIVSSVCDLISTADDTQECIDSSSLDGDVTESYFDLFWDKDATKLNRLQSGPIWEDNDFHPLLEECNSIPDEGVSCEVEEILRYLPTKSRSLDYRDVGSRNETTPCNPECSFWCHSSTQSCSNVSDKSLLDETTEFLTNSNDELMSIESTHDFSAKPPVQKQYLKRSFSVNDSDCYNRYSIDLSTKHLASSREALSYRHETANFKTLCNNVEVLNDDSGIMSYWSSHEDMFMDSGNFEMKDSNEYEESVSMWALFSGQHSLWSPLPDCNQPDNSRSNIMHKRVRELRRQSSLT